MKYNLLSDVDMKAMDALKDFHGGAGLINETIGRRGTLETRKQVLAEKGYGEMIADAEELAKQFPKVGDFEKANNISYRGGMGVGTAQVSGFQGARSPIAV